MRILVVEDSPHRANSFLSILDTFGAEVIHVTNLEDAKAAIEAGEFDVVSLDYQFPAVPGMPPGPNGGLAAEALVAAGYQGGVTLHSSHRGGCQKMGTILTTAGIRVRRLNLTFPETIEYTLNAVQETA